MIFDEASQIPLEEAIPAIYRSHQVIVVGDEMQLPPTTFFAAGRGEEESVVVEEEGERIEVDLDSDSFLTQSAPEPAVDTAGLALPQPLRIAHQLFQRGFYSGKLFTIPDRQRAMDNQAEIRVTASDQGAARTSTRCSLAASVFISWKTASTRIGRNPNEAAYIAQLVRGLLGRENQAEHRRGGVFRGPADRNRGCPRAGSPRRTAILRAQLEAEYVREENDRVLRLVRQEPGKRPGRRTRHHHHERLLWPRRAAAGC